MTQARTITRAQFRDAIERAARSARLNDEAKARLAIVADTATICARGAWVRRNPACVCPATLAALGEPAASHFAYAFDDLTRANDNAMVLVIS